DGGGAVVGEDEGHVAPGAVVLDHLTERPLLRVLAGGGREDLHRDRRGRRRRRGRLRGGGGRGRDRARGRPFRQEGGGGGGQRGGLLRGRRLRAERMGSRAQRGKELHLRGTEAGEDR